ncbi:MAG: PIN domain-containing protein [Gemmatimonadetes bacterium]|nr:PIN domain-containing protein [Gemmatimonadota bacterium]
MAKAKVCWDSTVFIAILTGEERTADDLQGLNEAIDLVDRRQLTVITSSLVRSEVLDRGSDAGVRERLRDLFRRPSFMIVEASNAISDKAGDIRDALLQSGRRLKTEDATFIATAILHGASALHTFDDDQLALSGLQEVDGLRIAKPHAEQTILPL